MQPMGSKTEQAEHDLIARLQQERKQAIEQLAPVGQAVEMLKQISDDLLEDETEIAYPEDRYGIACIGCGIEMHLQMIPHRNGDAILVGWIFCCEKCRPEIIGRRVWFGDKSE